MMKPGMSSFAFSSFSPRNSYHHHFDCYAFSSPLCKKGPVMSTTFFWCYLFRTFGEVLKGFLTKWFKTVLSVCLFFVFFYPTPLLSSTPLDSSKMLKLKITRASVLLQNPEVLSNLSLLIKVSDANNQYYLELFMLIPLFSWHLFQLILFL